MSQEIADMLLGMGFPPKIVTQAVENSSSLEDAIEWLQKYPEGIPNEGKEGESHKTDEDPNPTPAPDACETEKPLQDPQAQQEDVVKDKMYEATRVGDELPPPATSMTKEELEALLAQRRKENKIARRKAEIEEERIRREKEKEMAQFRDQIEERQREAERLKEKRAREAEKARRERVRKELEMEREMRKKNHGRLADPIGAENEVAGGNPSSGISPNGSTSSSSTVSSSAPKPQPGTCVIRIKQTNGTVLPPKEFPSATTTVGDIYRWIDTARTDGVTTPYSLVGGFPRRSYPRGAAQTLQELQFGSNYALMMV